MFRKIFLPAATCLLLASSLHAATLTVGQSASSQYSHIADAISAAQSGDCILVGQGTYHESLFVKKSLTIEAEGGNSITTIDGESIHRIMVIEGEIDVILRGLTFSNGFSEDAAALLIWNQANVIIEDCSFVNNYASGSNAVHLRHQGTSAAFYRCDFVRNECGAHSAALSMSFGGELLVEDCFFAHNNSSGSSGAVNCSSGKFDFRGNLFLGNTGAGEGALVIEGAATGTIANNTFHQNSGSGAVRLNATTTFRNNIVTSTQGGPGLAGGPKEMHFSNLFFDNDGGSVEGSGLGTNDITAEPIYCDYPSQLFTLCENSPALGNNNGSGTMGAFGEGCADCSPVSAGQRNLEKTKILFR